MSIAEEKATRIQELLKELASADPFTSAGIAAQIRNVAVQTGSGAIAQGDRAVAVGAGGMHVGGSVSVSGKGHAIGVGNSSHYLETSSKQGVDVGQLVELLQAIRGGLSAAGLDPKIHRAVEGELEAAVTEVKDEKPSGPILLTKLKSVGDLLASASATGASVATLGPMVQQAIDWVGRLFQ